MATTINQQVLRQDGIKGGGPVAAGAQLFIGSICFIDAVTGLYTDDANAGANKFGGIVIDYADNQSGQDGAINVNVFERGTFELPGTGIAQVDVGKKVYASDNYTIKLDPTDAAYIGTIVSVDGKTGYIRIAIDIQLP